MSFLNAHFFMRRQKFNLPTLAPGEPFPAVDTAWGPESPACGLLAMGGKLDVATLCNAYAQAIFPWFSEGQPILWWSTDPRMVLDVAHFRLHRSLRQTLKKFIDDPRCEIRIDTAFSRVIRACAQSQRDGPPGQQAQDERDEKPGTWIVDEMLKAYCELHRAGFAHSIETWVNGELVGGLYCVALGTAVFGESMFSWQPNASKIALAALVCLCRRQGIRLIDCQQNTAHLASLGAAEMPRAKFQAHVKSSSVQRPAQWQFDPIYWGELMNSRAAGT